MARVYVCRDLHGIWFVAGDALAAALDRGDVVAPGDLPLALEVETGACPVGLRFAQYGDCRIVAYARGGYCRNRMVPGLGWCLTGRGEELPEEVERALCVALAIDYAP